ncbi:MAG TPA: biotin synthase BioB [Desulfobacteraceae bacterium]|nr:biotin synthase BioB [Desulfobacteraceae bacterium]
MAESIRHIVASVLAGGRIDRSTALLLASEADRQKIWEGADRIRHHFNGARFSLCSIINTRSGGCSEDCRFCAQSARHRSNIEEYAIVDPDRALAVAAEMDRNGVHRLSLVTSGRSASSSLLDRLAEIYREMARTTLLKLCGSMGLLTRDKALRLREMGVIRYHCNLEASSRYFPRVCTTHTWEEKVETLKLAREAGLSLCSGGIIGMGETMADRIDLALELRELGVRSIPINILTPIPGTPLAGHKPLPVEEVLTTIALFRFINPEGIIRLAGGRQQLGAEQYRCFTAGANGAMVGNFLTTPGSSIEEDLRTFTAMGFSFA